MPESPAERNGPTGLPEREGGRDDGREDGRSRLWRALARPTRGQVVVAVLLAVVGFAGVTQVRFNQVDDTYAGMREQDLIDVLDGLAGTTQRAQSEIQRLEETRDELLSDTNARQAALDEARKQADVLAILAGVTPVSGPGVKITIKERSDEVELEAFINLVQSLRTAGAEAMQLNREVRVIAQTAFDDGTGGLLVDGELVEPPYVIDAIGNPDALVAALRFPGGPQDQFEENDAAELTFDDTGTIRIDSTVEQAEADFAEPQQ